LAAPGVASCRAGTARDQRIVAVIDDRLWSRHAPPRLPDHHPSLCCLGRRRPARAEYPTRPVSLIVAFTPGGPSDVLARIVRQEDRAVARPTVRDREPARRQAAISRRKSSRRAAPDGYTLLMGNNSILATNASLYRKIGYDAEKDFAPDQPDRLAGQPFWVVNPASAGEIDGRADRARQGAAGQAQLRFVRLWRGPRASFPASCSRPRAHIDIQHVRLQGCGRPPLQDVIAGHVQMMFGDRRIRRRTYP